MFQQDLLFPEYILHLEYVQEYLGRDNLGFMDCILQFWHILVLFVLVGHTYSIPPTISQTFPVLGLDLLALASMGKLKSS